jgi:glycosyltransferase involved in cell wall biosynthesis
VVLWSGLSNWSAAAMRSRFGITAGRRANRSEMINGVRWFPDRGYYVLAGSDRPGICINIKSPEVPPKEPTIFYTNDTNANDQDLSPYDAVIHISQWAADNIPVNNPNVFIVPHGYDEKLIHPAKKIPKQCLYASSPDRGLDRLLEAWPTVMAAHPDATLLVTYGVDRGPDIPGVTYLGDVDESLMAELYKTSDIWSYPCKGGELFCIAGIKAQAAGAVPVIVPEMALTETIRHGYFTTKEHFADVLTQVMDNENRADLEKRRAAMVADHYPTIADSTDVLLNVINTVINKQEKKTKQNEQLRSQ